MKEDLGSKIAMLLLVFLLLHGLVVELVHQNVGG